ncbi:MAG: hypothetical protein BJ554DRAFT_1201 [Olpidium bornovanus]|uniref:Uncharacterized protein n=1 Tax=Olpidium bornovanus TaxID=278681 RepID=A0A8H7ZSG1_9FUNG|nr:MAG: hypothetical protein BJ554DRAFT_1201 [Olpidium bornovanus]
MRAFVSNVDSPVGRNISRLLSATLPGFTRGREDGDEAGEEPAGGERQLDSAQKQLPYEVVGTLGSQPQTPGKAEPRATAEAGPRDAVGVVTEQGVEDTKASQSVAARKRAFAKDEAVEKFAVPGVKPKWVSEIIQNSAKEQLKDALLSSDVIIYDLLNSLEEAVWACECTLHREWRILRGRIQQVYGAYLKHAVARYYGTRACIKL